MDATEFLRDRRKLLGISQDELAARLSNSGQETSHARVSHWETGRNKMPLHDKGFRVALAIALEMDTNELMEALGYVIIEDERSDKARLAANLVDQLPPDVQDVAIDQLTSLYNRFAVKAGR
ncbi:MAG: helix-turn-helix transcriptional regulator [Anaerolineales bacterium]|nr:helix-turn-helix transcriptional regulator [Anaerolineales bacterium]